MSADEDTYLIEYVRLRLPSAPIEALQAWSTRFTKLRQQGRYDLCRRLLQGVKGMELPSYGVAVVRYGEGWLADRMGRWADAITAYEVSLEAFKAAGMPSFETVLLMNIGSIHQDRSAWAQAEQAYRKALSAAVAEERGGVLNNLGGLCLLRDDIDEAERCYSEAIELLHAAGDKYNEAAASAGLGAVRREQGRVEEAQSLLLTALATYQRLGDPYGVASTLGSLALLHQFHGRLDDALRLYEQVLAIFEAIGDQAGIAKTLGNLGIVGLQDSDTEQARSYFEQALGAYRELGDRHGEAVMLTNLALAHERLGDEAAAVAYAAQARRCSEAEGFTDQLDRLDARLS